MKKEVTHNIIILVVLLAAVAIIFANANLNFTGHVTIGDQECDGEWTHIDSDCINGFQNKTWTNITPTTNCDSSIIEENVSCGICVEDWQCAEWEDCINNSQIRLCTDSAACGTSDNKPEESQVCVSICDVNNLILCENQTSCEATEVGGFWYADNCYDTEPVCGTDFLELCTNETTCTGAEGYWYSDLCHTDPQCTLRTCDSLSYECGSTSDGCDGTLDCGDCGSGYSCNSDHVCEADETTDDSDDSDTSSSSTESESFSSSDMVSSKKCVPAWQCTDWSECADGTQTRTCTDSKNCKTEEGRPEISQSCTIPETCFDEIRNQNEQGIDCGGVCEKKCSIFTIIGSAITGPTGSSKNFFVENKTATFIVLGVLVLLGGGVVGLMFFLKKTHKKLTDLLPHNLISVFMKKGLISND